jgi:hypothetical protein
MQFIGLWPIPTEIGEPGKEISGDYGLPASMLPQGFMVSPIAV